jgi:hypothetical protein
MKNFNFLLWACFALFTQSLWSQPIVKYGQVGVDEISKNVYEIDSSADAIILYEKGISRFEGNVEGWFDVIHENHTRIKILKSSAFELATHEIILYEGGTEKESLLDLDAQAYNLESGQIVKTKMEKSSVFRENTSKNYRKIKFTVPNVKEGTILEFKYSTKSPYYSEIPTWYFQSSHPTLWSEYDVTIPGFFNFVSAVRGTLPFEINKNSTENASYRINTSSVASSRNFENFSTQANTYVWAIEDVPAIKQEPFTTSLRNHTSSVNFQLAQHLPPLAVKNFTSSWETLTSEFYSHESFGKDIFTPSKTISEFVSTITVGATTDLEKAKKIYYHLQNNFKIDETNSIYIQESLKKMIEKKAGYDNEMNLLLTACLNALAKNSASPIVLSTRNHGVVNPLYPLKDKFNKVITQATIDGKKYWLDASIKHLPFGQLDQSCNNGYARVIDTRGSEVFISPDSTKSRDIVSVKMTMQDGKLNARYETKTSMLTGYGIRKEFGADKVAYFNHVKKDKTIESDLFNTKIDSLEKDEFPLFIGFDYSLPFEPEDSIVYINPFTFAPTLENPFKSQKRLYPVELAYLLQEYYNFNFTIPPGYKLVEIPKSIAFKLDDTNNSALFDFKSVESKGVISIRSRLSIDRSMFLPEEYTDLKDLFNHLVKKHSELIVLKKI